MEGPQPVHVNGLRGPGRHSATDQGPPSLRGGLDHWGLCLPRNAPARAGWELISTAIINPASSGVSGAGDTVTWQQELARTPMHLSAFGEGADGELYLLDHDRTHQVYRLVRNPAAKQLHDFPRRLSQTGLFASTRDHRPAPGVIPYSVNSELWADGATAERFLAVPGNGRIGLDDQGIWQFPDGSVLVRTVSIAARAGQTGSRRRLKPRSSTRRTTPGGLIRMSGTTTRPMRSWPMPKGRPGRSC